MSGWKDFLQTFPWFEGKNGFPLPAYSEFMPPMHIGIRPYDAAVYPWHFREDDPYGFYVSEDDELLHLQPGLLNIGQQMMDHLILLGKGKLPPSIAGRKNRNLKDNPFWPDDLAEKAGSLFYERYVTFASLSLSKTKDDKGRGRWTFFGGSEQGPEKAFWKSFFRGDNEEYPESFFLDFMGKIFHHAYDRKTFRAARSSVGRWVIVVAGCCHAGGHPVWPSGRHDFAAALAAQAAAALRQTLPRAGPGRLAAGAVFRAARGGRIHSAAQPVRLAAV